MLQASLSHFCPSLFFLFVPWGAGKSYGPNSRRGEASLLSAGVPGCLLATVGKETAPTWPMTGPDSCPRRFSFIDLYSFVSASRRFLTLIYPSLGCVETSESAEAINS